MDCPSTNEDVRDLLLASPERAEDAEFALAAGRALARAHQFDLDRWYAREGTLFDQAKRRFGSEIERQMFVAAFIGEMSALSESRALLRRFMQRC